MKRIRDAQKVSGLAPAAARYIAREADELESIVALGRANWQSLIPAEDLAGWKSGTGRWKVVSPDVLVSPEMAPGRLVA